MTPTPGPIPVTVVSSPEWWQILGALSPLAVLLAAIVAAIVGLMTLNERARADARALTQKTDADSRSEWWRRAQWAFDAAVDDKPERQEIGLAVLEVLNTSDLAGKEETRIIAEAWMKPLEAGEATLDLLDPVPDNGSKDDSEEVER